MDPRENPFSNIAAVNKMSSRGVIFQTLFHAVCAAILINLYNTKRERSNVNNRSVTEFAPIKN